MMRRARRKSVALRSYLTLGAIMLILWAVMLSKDPYSDPSLFVEGAALGVLPLATLNLWYFRREWPEMRQEWVERRPWLRHVVKTEAAGATPFIARGLSWLLLGIIILTVWVTFSQPG